MNASGNNNAFRMLERDVNNMRACFARAAPELLDTDYAHEMWALYERSELTPETPLTGRFRHSRRRADVGAVMRQIDEARREAEIRQRGREAAERDED